MLNLTLVFSGLLLVILGFVVLYSNSKATTNRALGVFIFSGLFWLITNLSANIAKSPSANLMFSRLALVGAAILPFSFLIFCYYFTGQSRHLSRKKTLLFVLPILMLLVSTPTHFNIEQVSATNLTIQPGYSYLLLIIVLIVYFSYGIYLLAKSYPSALSIKKKQLNYIFLGITLTFIPGVALSGLLPLLGKPYWAGYGPNVVIFFSIFTSIAIIRHKLLDIRLIVARSLAYLSLLSAMVGIYGVAIFAISFVLFRHEAVRTTAAQKTLYVTLAIFLSFTFQPLKKFFDKVTNELFYRDSYDTQAFLNELNTVLVSTIELEILLRQSSDIIERNLKPEFVAFAIKKTANTDSTLIASGAGGLSPRDITHLENAMEKINQKVLITDELENPRDQLRNLLINKNIAIIARLSASTRNTGSVGYLILGHKKSGNPYNSQDVRNVDIIVSELVIAIQNALRFEEIQAFNATLQQKINEATHRLRTVNERLKTLDETKDEFISMASHQLRTPLTSVKGYLSMVLEGDAGKITRDQRKLLDQAFISSQRMVYLIADLLNVSRLRTGKFIIEPTQTNLAEVIAGEVDQLKETAKARNLGLTYHKPADFPLLILDETKVRQVAMNFIDNAIYYTPSGGHIRVELEDLGQSIEFRVVDDGLGVPKADQHHLFTKFYRAGNARKARPDGTGLGLFMAKKVVVAQGGSIIFKSQEGKGSTFGFTFAKAKLQSPISKPKDEPQLAAAK